MSVLSPPVAIPAPASIDCWWLPYHREQGRAPLLRVLARYLQVAPQAIELVTETHGRPRLGGALAGHLDFNWSHSGQHAAIAIASDLRVGIDIESRQRRLRMLELARRYFAASESQALEQLSAPAMQAAFWALWTGKEAVLKATGRGISHGLQHVCFQPLQHGWPLLTVDAEDAGDWQLQRPALATDYSIALAWQGPPAKLQWFLPDT